VEHHFDNYERDIEYQFGEIKQNKQRSTWDVKEQLVSNEIIQSMLLELTQGSGCEKIETYTLQKGPAIIKLEWLSAQRLVKRYSIIVLLYSSRLC